MKNIIITCLVLIFAASNSFCQSSIDEIKVGIYAKDLKKIYSSLSEYLGQDISETPIEKWIELGDMLAEINDYASAWQFYMLANVAVFQNEKLSKLSKADKYKLITEKSESMLKKANPSDLVLIQKYKYSIIPGRINLVNNLANMLKNSERTLFSSKSHKTISHNNEIKAIEDPNIARNSFGGTLQIEPIVYDEAPYYDYTEINRNLMYPKRAFEERLEGKVLIELIIDEKGNIEEKKIIETSNSIFDDNALAVVDYVRFKPAKRSGIEYKSKIVLPIYFEINK